MAEYDNSPSLASRKLLTAVIALVVVTLIIISRKPILMVEPRFWWDEGMINYAFAYRHSWLETLLSPHQGYFSLMNNLVALAEITLLPTETAPFIGTYTSFLLQLLPHMIVWGGRSPYWSTTPRRATTSFLIMFNTMSCAIWLSVVTLQFHLSLVAFLILAENWENRSRKCIITYMAVLAVAGLTGVVSCFLTPFFLLKYWSVRNGAARAFCATMLAACALGLMGVAWFHYYGLLYKSEQRFAYSFHRFMSLLVRGTLGLMAFGADSHIPSRKYPLIIPQYLLLASICIYLARPLKWRERMYFLGSFLTLSVMDLLSSIEASRGQARYFYAPNVILSLMVMQSLFLPPAREHMMRRLTAGLLLVVVAVTGVHNFYNNFYCYNPDWPKWRDEVAKWRADPNYLMFQHPYGDPPKWTVDLRPE